jgi:hypothetical protein
MPTRCIREARRVDKAPSTGVEDAQGSPGRQAADYCPVHGNCGQSNTCPQQISLSKLQLLDKGGEDADQVDRAAWMMFMAHLSAYPGWDSRTGLGQDYTPLCYHSSEQLIFLWVV